MATVALWCIFLSAVGVLANIQPGAIIGGQVVPWNVNKLPYQFSSIINETQQQKNLEQSMREIEQAVNIEGYTTCISFRNMRTGGHYMYIRNSNSGLCLQKENKTVNQREYLDLRDDCMDKRDMISSLLVLMGLYHENQRSDRNQYIQVHMDNVQDDVVGSFDTMSPRDMNLSGFPYDFHSITHFGEYEYAKNHSLPTITTNVSGVSFGRNSILSFYDVLKVQTLYNCAKGYTMLRNNSKHFQQKSTDTFYPQWRDTSENLPNYMTAKCSKNDSNDMYTLTVLHGATWTSKLPLPPGNFCISVDICIGSSSQDIKSYIQLMGGSHPYMLNYTQQSGQWERLNIRHTSENDWNVVLKGHILWGEDVLALDNLIVRRSVDVECRL